jgi:hypothetical protein
MRKGGMTAAILAASIRAPVDHAGVEIELDRRTDVLVVYGLGDLCLGRLVRFLVPLRGERTKHFAAALALVCHRGLSQRVIATGARPLIA